MTTPSRIFTARVTLPWEALFVMLPLEEES